MKKEEWMLCEAAAGTGKTVALVRRYLQCLKDGIPVDRIVAITFTRKAAAELLERISDVLHVLLEEGGPQHRRAMERVGENFHDLYGKYAPPPDEIRTIRQALAGLGAAPVGTVDGFVQKFLGEFALHAALPVPGGGSAPLDFPIAAGTDPARFLEEAARELLTPSDGVLGPEIRTLLRHYDLAKLLKLLTEAPARPVPEPATAEEAFRPLAAQFAAHLAALLGPGDLAASLVEVLGLEPTASEGWPEALDAALNKAGKPAAPAFLRWLRSGATVDDAPPELLGFFWGFSKRSPWFRWLSNQENLPAFFGRVRVDDATVRLPLETLGDRLPGWQLEAHDGTAAGRETVEQVRRLLYGLRRQVATRGWERAAREGALSYDALLEAATALCRQPPPELHTRFRALLVDEVQDSSRAQVDFYLALARTNPEMSCFFVGDRRQSIYLFRGADPTSLNRLSEICQRGNLLQNFRSIPSLVEAHRQLFGEALNRGMDAFGLEGLQDLAGLTAGKVEKTGDAAQPVLLVRDLSEESDCEEGRESPPTSPEKFDGAAADARALEAFAERIQQAWSTWEAAAEVARKEGRTPERAPTAAVLAPIWAKAAAARDILRARLLSNAQGLPRAYLDGGGKWLSGPVVQDVLLFLRALLDPGDAIAWLGVWKHPAVGLSDAALARVRSGQGLQPGAGDGEEAPVWLRELGWLVEAEGLVPPHDDVDIRAFAFARGPLRRAREGLNRDGAARTLDRLATRLGWREVLSASPDDDGPAQLEVLLEWLRSLDFAGTDPRAMIDLLRSDLAHADPPLLEVHRPEEHVSCITIFKAKGLQWDHVCVLSPGKGPGGGRAETNDALTLELASGTRSLLGVRLDPRGALCPESDGIRNLVSAIAGVRKNEELLRLTYVAITRARRSVVMALPNERQGGIQPLLSEAWRPGPALDRVEFQQWTKPTSISLPPQSVVHAADGATWTDRVPAPRLWREETPSKLHEALSKADRQVVAEDIAQRVFSGGTLIGPLFKPVKSPKGTGLNVRDLGTLVHGWFERWRFRGPVVRADIDGYLSSSPSPARSALGDFLEQVSTALSAASDSPFWRLVSEPGAELHFEWPFVAPGPTVRLRDGDGRFLLTGSMDLLIRSADGRWTILDFKAGQRHPRTAPSDPAQARAALIADAHLKTYGPQLEGYRAAVNAALAAQSQSVDRVGLWFVRIGAGVIW